MAVNSAICGAQIRKIILEQSKRAHVGHIGSALSIADLIAAFYQDILQISSPSDGDRDRIILSKGHAVLAVYAALFLKGWITEAQLHTYCADNSLLGVHPEHTLAGIDFSTGSLGQGLSFGVGAALAARLQRSQRRIFVVLSDAECNEGSVWEAIMFASHHQLANIIAVVDFNQQQALGYTREILDLSPMSERWRAFGWDAHDVDGHDVAAIARTVSNFDLTSGAPHVIIAHTVFGKGVSYMEGQIKWHYFPMSDEEYQQALGEIAQSI
ncbi:MAG: transketolase [Cyanobacteria bacterium P01_G01_bin.38]